MSSAPRVLGLLVRPGEDLPVKVVERARARVDGAFVGDHGGSARRGVTLLDEAEWRRACEDLGVDLPWTTRRANVLVQGVDLRTLVGRRVRLGGLEILVRGDLPPCGVMERAHVGLRRALEPPFRAGVHGQVVGAGEVRVGDTVVPVCEHPLPARPTSGEVPSPGAPGGIPEEDRMRLFLHSGGRFAETREDLLDFLGPVRRVAFVPYALANLDEYVEKVRSLASTWGLEVRGVHEGGDPRGAIETAEAVFVGGGNTFRLLTRAYELDLLEAIRRRVREGVPYVGSSAGSNLACPTIMTTNDMPIVYPPSYDALGLVPFQINPHYQDPDPASAHMGETRQERIREYHELNDRPVIGLREGSSLRREGGTLKLVGSIGARLFRRGREPREYVPGDRLDELLQVTA